jgi:hypothetical protein
LDSDSNSNKDYLYEIYSKDKNTAVDLWNPKSKLPEIYEETRKKYFYDIEKFIDSE